MQLTSLYICEQGELVALEGRLSRLGNKREVSVGKRRRRQLTEEKYLGLIFIEP